MHHVVRLLLGCACLLGATVATAQQTRTFTGQYSFGDSLSDNGNLFALSGRRIPPAPYFNGRFSNGPVFTELLGNPLVPGATLSTQGRYVNFAVGGANALLPNDVPTLNQQIGIYRVQGFPAQRDDLFTVLAGANDLIPVIPLGATNPSFIDTASGLIAQAVSINVQLLVTLGAKNIVVAGLPNLGLTPRSLLSGGPGGAAAALGTRASNAFNNELRSRLGTIANASPDVNLVYVDLHGVTDFIAQEYRALGFSNASSFFLAPAALGGGAGDPNSYVFWDDIHPTARMHALIAGVVVEQLNPEIPLGFTATLGSAALALEGLAASTVDARASQLAASQRPHRRADVYASFTYGDGGRARDGWRPKFDYTAQVVAAGVDTRWSEGVFVGGALNVGRLNTDVRRSGGDFTVEDAAGRLYAVWHGGPVSLIADADYGVLTVKGIHRSTALGGLKTNGKTSGDHWGAGVKAAWAVDFNAISVRPWFGLRTERVSLESYTEKDIPALSMDFADQDARSSSGALGVDASMNWRLGGRGVRLDGRAAWHGEIGSRERRVSGRLANNFTRPTSLVLEDGDGDGFELGGAATLFFGKTWSASLGYTADIRTHDKLANRVMLSLQSGF